jgi:hypothetical protein
MATVRATWTLPAVSRNQRPIDRVLVQLSADGGQNFADFANVRAEDVQEIVVTELEPGDYAFRHAVYDIDERQGSPVVTPFVVDAQAPGVVQNVQVTVTP